MKNELPKNLKVQVQGLEWGRKYVHLARKGKEYLAPNWPYGSRSLDLKCRWLLKDLSFKTMGCTRSKGKLFSMISAWVRWYALVKNLALQKLVWTTVFQAARISLPELLFPSSNVLVFFLPLVFNRTRAPTEVVLHCGDSTCWLFLSLCSGVWWLPVEYLQWNDLTQEGPLNRALRFSCKINPKTS